MLVAGDEKRMLKEGQIVWFEGGIEHNYKNFTAKCIDTERRRYEDLVLGGNFWAGSMKEYFSELSLIEQQIRNIDLKLKSLRMKRHRLSKRRNKLDN